MAEQGKTGKIIKAVLKAQAGRKHRDGLNLDVIKDGAGKHYVTPESVHSAATTGFQSRYDMPENYRETLHTTPDWRPHLNDFSTFRASFPDCQVPEDLMLRIFQALQDVPNAWKVREHLSVELTTAPSLEELTHRIARLKHNSSAGMSGLSYNMSRHSVTLGSYMHNSAISPPNGNKWRERWRISRRQTGPRRQVSIRTPTT